MKKIIVLILSIIMVIVMCVSFTGCSAKESQGFQNSDFAVIKEGEDFATSYAIIYHRETKVMYLFIKSGYGGGLTVMLDENGNPLLYEEE